MAQYLKEVYILIVHRNKLCEERIHNHYSNVRTGASEAQESLWQNKRYFISSMLLLIKVIASAQTFKPIIGVARRQLGLIAYITFGNAAGVAIVKAGYRHIVAYA